MRGDADARPSPRRLEHDHLPNTLAASQTVERRVDVVQAEAVGEEAVHREAAGLVEGDEAGEIAAGNSGAHVAAAHGALLGDQADGGDGEKFAGVGEASGHRSAAAAGRGVRLGKHGLVADRFKDEGGAAPGCVADGGHGLLAGGKGMGGAEGEREVAFFRQRVDHDDGVGTGGDGAEHAGQADAAEAEDGDAGARGHARGVHHGAHSRHHRAAEQGGNLHRQ